MEFNYGDGLSLKRWNNTRISKQNTISVNIIVNSYKFLPGMMVYIGLDQQWTNSKQIYSWREFFFHITYIRNFDGNLSDPSASLGIPVERSSGNVIMRLSKNMTGIRYSTNYSTIIRNTLTWHTHSLTIIRMEDVQLSVWELHELRIKVCDLLTKWKSNHYFPFSIEGIYGSR